MTKKQITQSVALNTSGTKTDLKITPRYPLESVRTLDRKGTQNKPHQHVRPSFFKRLFGGTNENQSQ